MDFNLLVCKNLWILDFYPLIIVKRVDMSYNKEQEILNLNQIFTS